MCHLAVAVTVVTSAFIIADSAQHIAEEVGYSALHDFHMSMYQGHPNEGLSTQLPLTGIILIELSYVTYIMTAYISRLRKEEAERRGAMRPIVLMLVSTSAFATGVVLMIVDSRVRYLMANSALLVEATCLYMLVSDTASYGVCCGCVCDVCCAKLVYGRRNTQLHIVPIAVDQDSASEANGSAEQQDLVANEEQQRVDV